MKILGLIKKPENNEPDKISDGASSFEFTNSKQMIPVYFEYPDKTFNLSLLDPYIDSVNLFLKAADLVPTSLPPNSKVESLNLELMDNEDQNKVIQKISFADGRNLTDLKKMYDDKNLICIIRVS